MTYLVVCLGVGKGTWNEVLKLTRIESWEKVFIITTTFGKEKFTAIGEYIIVDDLVPMKELILAIIQQLKGKILDTEVALNYVSGTGNLHMATMAALLKLGLGIRLVTVLNERMEEL